jgi:hypothetical protein
MDNGWKRLYKGTSISDTNLATPEKTEKNPDPKL